MATVSTDSVGDEGHGDQSITARNARGDSRPRGNVERLELGAYGTGVFLPATLRTGASSVPNKLALEHGRDLRAEPAASTAWWTTTTRYGLPRRLQDGSTSQGCSHRRSMTSDVGRRPETASAAASASCTWRP